MEDLWYSCSNKTLPTIRAVETILKWLNGTNLSGILRAEKEETTKGDQTEWLVKLVFKKNPDSQHSRLNPGTAIKWIPDGMDFNGLAPVVLSTGDLPNKTFARTLARQLKKGEIVKDSGKNKNERTLDL